MDLLPADWIHAAAARHGDRCALRCGHESLSYEAMARAIEVHERALAACGVGQGQVVAWLGLNSGAMLTLLFACARRGTLFVPLNWRLAPPEHRAMLAECRPALLFADAPFAAPSDAAAVAAADTRCIAVDAADRPPHWMSLPDFLEAGQGGEPPPRVAVSPQSPLLLCYTSGSTGRPKGVLLSHEALCANADASVDMHAMVESDRVLTTLPLFHVGGLNIQTLPALREGCRVELHPKFDPAAALTAIERERITLTVLVPAQLDAVMALPQWPSTDLSSLRAISTGSTVVPERLCHAVHARGVPLIQVWGATETSPIAACQHADEAVRTAGSAGRAALGVELRIVDAAGDDLPTGQSGEILVRGRNVMSAYWQDPQATARVLVDGWFHSGDRGRLDAQGFLWVDGRIKDMIISGGENVSPAEVEIALQEDPDVAEAAVVGRPDARWGERVVAVVVPRPGVQIAPREVMARLEGRIARFKQPKQVFVVDALPRTALGKVRKEDVRSLVAQLDDGAARPASRESSA
ncbi:MAG: AMP-binding protein [Burkholderiales bacterium]|nr:AMP-binding protein [Burkholderiales bacterium]